MSEQYIVVCRDDRQRNGRPGSYLLATRRVFGTRPDAEGYRRTIAKSRQAIIVAGPFTELRHEAQP